MVSAYRPKEEQNTLYWRKVKQYTDKGYSDLEAQKVGGTIVKRPGFSEHNCGLAMDVGGSGDYTLEQTFANTAAYTWLMEHCADYGFILRFPEGKEDITGVIYEPWHYRYVGVEAARYIMDNDVSGGISGTGEEVKREPYGSLFSSSYRQQASISACRGFRRGYTQWPHWMARNVPSASFM